MRQQASELLYFIPNWEKCEVQNPPIFPSTAFSGRVVRKNMEIILLRRCTLCLLLHPVGRARPVYWKDILAERYHWDRPLGGTFWIQECSVITDQYFVNFTGDKARLIRSYSFAGVLGFLYSSHTRIVDAGCSYAPYFLPWNPVCSDKSSLGGVFFFACNRYLLSVRADTVLRG